VEVQNKYGQYVPCRTLLDSASHSHFITERCVQRLRLSRNKTHAQIQGISSVNIETFHNVSINLKSRHTNWHTTLNCAILSHITGNTLSTKLDTRTWKIPKGIKLADESLNNQETLIYSLELIYSTRWIDRAVGYYLQFPSSTSDSSCLDTLCSNSNN